MKKVVNLSDALSIFEDDGSTASLGEAPNPAVEKTEEDADPVDDELKQVAADLSSAFVAAMSDVLSPGSSAPGDDLDDVDNLLKDEAPPAVSQEADSEQNSEVPADAVPTTSDPVDNAEKNPEAAPGSEAPGGESGGGDDAARVKQLEAENAQLKEKLASMSKETSESADSGLGEPKKEEGELQVESGENVDADFGDEDELQMEEFPCGDSDEDPDKKDKTDEE